MWTFIMSRMLQQVMTITKLSLSPKENCREGAKGARLTAAVAVKKSDKGTACMCSLICTCLRAVRETHVCDIGGVPCRFSFS